MREARTQKESGNLTQLRRWSRTFEEVKILEYTGQSTREQNSAQSDLQRLSPPVFHWVPIIYVRKPKLSPSERIQQNNFWSSHSDPPGKGEWKFPPRTAARRQPQVSSLSESEESQDSSDSIGSSQKPHGILARRPSIWEVKFPDWLIFEF